MIGALIELTCALMIFYQVTRKFMISAGEASGTLYGAMLSREVKGSGLMLIFLVSAVPG